MARKRFSSLISVSGYLSLAVLNLAASQFGGGGAAGGLEVPDDWEMAADAAETNLPTGQALSSKDQVMRAASPAVVIPPPRVLRQFNRDVDTSADDTADMELSGGGGGGSAGLDSPLLTSRSAANSTYSEGSFFSGSRGRQTSAGRASVSQPSPTLSLASGWHPRPFNGGSPKFGAKAAWAERADVLAAVAEVSPRDLALDFQEAAAPETSENGLSSPRTPQTPPRTPQRSALIDPMTTSPGGAFTTPGRQVLANVEARTRPIKRRAEMAELDAAEAAAAPVGEAKPDLVPVGTATADIAALASVAHEESRGVGGDAARVQRHQTAVCGLIAESCGYPGEPAALFTGPQQTNLKKLRTPERAKRMYVKLREDSAAHKNVQDLIRLEAERPTGLQIGRFWVPNLEHAAARHLAQAKGPKLIKRPGEKPATQFDFDKYHGSQAELLKVLERAAVIGGMEELEKDPKTGAETRSYHQLLRDPVDNEPISTYETVADPITPQTSNFRLLTSVYPFISLTQFDPTDRNKKYPILFNPDVPAGVDKHQMLKRQIELSGTEVAAMARVALNKYQHNPKRVANPLKFHGLDGKSDIYDISGELALNSQIKAARIKTPEMGVLVQLPKLDDVAAGGGSAKKARLAGRGGDTR